MGSGIPSSFLGEETTDPRGIAIVIATPGLFVTMVVAIKTSLLIWGLEFTQVSSEKKCFGQSVNTMYDTQFQIVASPNLSNKKNVIVIQNI